MVVKKEFGLREPSAGSHIIRDGRAVIGILDVPCLRPTIIASLYLVEGEGLVGTNNSILNKLGRAVRAQGNGYQVIIGGDFQNDPERACEHELPRSIACRVVAAETARGTYRAPQGASHIDYLIISDG